MKSFSTLNSKIVLDTPSYKLEKRRVIVPDGSEVDWYIQRHPDVVIVIPRSTDKQFLLQRNYKHVIDAMVLEFCTGIIEDTETPEEAAKRELKEETGCTSKDIKKIGQALAAPNSNDITYHFFIAENCIKTHDTSFDVSEHIESFWVKDEQALHREIKSSEPFVTTASLAAWGAYKML